MSERAQRAIGAAEQAPQSMGRKAQIAKAVVTLLGARGSRGLTHRAIDEYLGLPPGSTSYYYRTKIDLLTAGFEEVIQLNRHSTEEYNSLLFDKEFRGDPVKVMAEREYLGWLKVHSEENRPRILARFEFFLMASRDPGLREMEERIIRRLFLVDVEAFTRAKARNPRRAAAELGDLRRGNVTTYVLVPMAIWGRKLDLEYFERKVAGIIRETDEFESDLDEA